MARCDYKSLKHHQYRNTTTATAAREKEQYPSFSSTLLDSIYRSIDETSGEANTPTPMKNNNKQVHSTTTSSKNSYSKEEDVANYKRACLIEKWMEKKKLASGGEKHTIVRQKSMAEFHRASKSSSAMMNLSSSSNSDSSFSGSEAESNNNTRLNVTSSGYKFHQPKPIRTKHQSDTAQNQYNHHKHDSSTHQVEHLHRQKIKHESYNIDNNINNSSDNNVATKTKKLTRALKIYNDLKKTKQPISPGGRLASFINSLFTNGNSKKPNSNTTSQHSTTQLFDTNNLTKSSTKSPYSSTCSSASSFSRSCLSKAPKGSSLNNNNNSGGAKRSVRFYPVSVIVDEDCKPCGQKSLHEDHHHLNHQAVVEQKSRNVDSDMKFVTEAFDGDDDDDDDDVTSCTSSDLFELDNLSSIGNDCYREELPVYETTRFDHNRVISKGLIV